MKSLIARRQANCMPRWAGQPRPTARQNGRLVEFTPPLRSEVRLAELPPMDPLHLGIALGPLATYFLVLGGINLSRRPVLASGGRDAAALALALIGLVVTGPMELFLVEEAAVLYGGWVWAIMVAA